MRLLLELSLLRLVTVLSKPHRPCEMDVSSWQSTTFARMKVTRQPWVDALLSAAACEMWTIAAGQRNAIKPKMGLLPRSRAECSCSGCFSSPMPLYSGAERAMMVTVDPIQL